MSKKPDPHKKRTRGEASRHNGAKSRGPTTPEGKSKSSQNALKHGLGSRSLVLASESPILFAEYKDHYWKHFRPRNLVEADLVIEMVGARWRLRRIWSHETALLDTEIDKRLPPDPDPDDPGIDVLVEQALAFKTLADESNSLEMLHRYETRYRRCYERALRNLQQLRENDPPDPKATIFDNIPGPPQEEPTPPKPPKQASEPQSPILRNEPRRTSNLSPLIYLAILIGLLLLPRTATANCLLPAASQTLSPGPRCLRVVARHSLGDTSRLVLPIDFDRHLPPRLPAAFHLANLQKLVPAANARPCSHRIDETHAVQPVVDRHEETLPDRQGLKRKLGNQRQCQKTMRDRGLKRRFAPAALDINVNPLVVPGRRREGVNTLLRHLQPLAHGDFLAGQAFQLGNIGYFSFWHLPSIRI